MRILVVGSLLGDINIINRYIKESNADIVLCTGDMGIFYKKLKNNPKGFKDNTFFNYLEGSDAFHRPVYTVKGPHDNISLCRRINNGEINIYNFNIIKDGETVRVKNNTKDPIPMDYITIGGIGGTYSPTNYDVPLEETKERHFNIESVNKIREKKLNILLMHDVIANHSKKDVEYSLETLSLIDDTMPFYYIVGKYDWWGSAKVGDSNFIMMPCASKGYLVIDTNKEWKAEGVRFDMNIGGVGDTT